MGCETWTHTHTITHVNPAGTRRQIAVMLTPDGAAYTREEWDATDTADWECRDGAWFFHGRALPGMTTVNLTEATRR